MLIKAAINGGRKRAEHPAVPVSPEAQAADVVECLQAGAGAVHLHVRVTSGSTEVSAEVNESSRQEICAPSEKESLYAEDVARTLVAVRAAVPDAAIGVSTGAWILPGKAARFAAVAAWEVLPDFASVNFSEDGAVELARLLFSRGVGVEAGLCAAADAEVFLKSGLTASCLRVLLEPQEEELASALETVNAIEKVLDARNDSGTLGARGDSGNKEVPFPPLLLHGTEATAWPMMDEAIARGYDVRIGLEDTLVMPDGSFAKDNAELVAETVRRVQAAGRDCLSE